MEIEEEQASTIDVARLEERIMEHLKVEVGKCPRCGWRARGEHSRLAKGQWGATAHRIRARVRGQALRLYCEPGVPAVIEGYCGIGLTQGRLTSRALKLAELHAALGQSGAAIEQRIGQAERVYTGDTGWKPVGQPAQLIGFFTEESASYQIRSHQGIQEVLPAAFGGTVQADWGRGYDAAEFEPVKQQKCPEPVRCSLEGGIQNKASRDKTFELGLKGLLEEGCALRYRVRDGTLGVRATCVKGAS